MLVYLNFYRDFLLKLGFFVSFEHAIIMYKNLADETKRNKKLLPFHLSPRSQSNLIDFTNFHYSNSQVELTIE